MSYVSTLDPPSKKRYLEKLKLIDGVDPYIESDDFSTAFDDLPPITYMDVINYLVFTPSPFSAEDMKAYKSLEAYNQVLEGWVRDVKALKHLDMHVVKGKVSALNLRT